MKEMNRIVYNMREEGGLRACSRDRQTDRQQRCEHRSEIQ